MKQSFNKLIETLKDEGLTKTEKRHIKMAVFETIKNPYERVGVINWQGFFYLVRSHALAFSLIFIFVFTGAGATLAAENSLPGDPLYGIKIHVNEGFRSALALHPSHEAKWRSEQAQRRLLEAKTLASRGELDEDTQKDLERRFALHTNEARDAIAALEESQNLVGAVDAASSLESILSAQRSILRGNVALSGGGVSEEPLKARTQKEFRNIKNMTVGLGGSLESTTFDSNEEVSSTTEMSSESVQQNFLSLVEENLSEVSEEREQVENEIKKLPESQLRSASSRAKRQAEIDLKSARRAFDEEAQTLLLKEEVDLINREFQGAEFLLKRGSGLIEEGQYIEAYTQLKRSSRISNQLNITISSLEPKEDEGEVLSQGQKQEASTTITTSSEDQPEVLDNSDAESTDEVDLQRKGEENKGPGNILNY